MSIRDAAALDNNFAIPSSISRDGLVFYDAESLAVYGVKLIDGKYRRMDDAAARGVNENIFLISTECAGGRVRFRTDSARIAVYAEYASVAKVPNYSFSATMGFDIYSGERLIGVFVPPFDARDSLESVITTPLSDGECHDYTINLPIASEVTRLYIGIDEGARMLPATPYKTTLPVVYYGSSTTQGACASHPGCSYPSIISRALDCDFINLAFWGNAKGEATMAEYIAGLEMSAFVYDYDYNTPSTEHLAATHARMFDIIRASQPTLPIIILSAPKPYASATSLERERIIRETYESAVARGDKNVYFLSGRELLAPVRDVCLGDNIHPSDVGFLAIARGIIPILEKIL